MTSEIKVNTIKKNSGSSITIGENGDTITVTTGATVSGGTVASTIASQSITARGDGSSEDGKIILNCYTNNHGVSIKSPPHSAGATYTLVLPNNTGTNGQVLSTNGSGVLSFIDAVETKPTISSISPTVITNDATNVTINGANFVSVPIVEAISSTGVITSANSITFNSASQLVANFTLATDGTYFIRIENNDGNAVRSGSAILTVSDEPAWVTAAGSLGEVDVGGSISFTVQATDATSYAVTSGALPGGASLNTSTGAITGTESGATQTTTYNFSITATDAQGQTGVRAFSITVTAGIQNAMRFDP